MGLIGEYIAKNYTSYQYEKELQELIKKYNKKTNSYLFIYAAALEKNIPEVSLSQEDYYFIFDMLRKINEKDLHFYIETPGGNGITVEEIVRFLRSKFDKVSFVISGEAKSAGTILALSGDEIYMTESGSLGPIDAQVHIGRMYVSAHDYIKWIDKLREQAKETGKLNPIDANMIAQISPGEYEFVYNRYQLAKDLIIKWLPKYKFRNWEKTETRGKKVTKEDKIQRAQEIADKLVDQEIWKSHGRSLKIQDLQKELKINRIDDDVELAEIVYRIQAVIKLLFQTTSVFKMFVMANDKIFRHATTGQYNQQEQMNVVKAEIICAKCKKTHKLYGKFVNDKNIDDQLKAEGYKNIISEKIIKCTCGNEIDPTGVINDIENKINKKLV